MDQNAKLICPQCLHQNSKDSLQCQLCDFLLNQDKSDETIAPQFPHSSQCTDVTIAPDFSPKSDPNLTVAPEVLLQEKQANKDQHTFHLAGDLAHFEIHEILGQGGMGAVYHAKDKTLQRDVAIKMLRPVLASNQLSADALLDEARMASKLNHPNIVTIYDVARAADSNYIVMEWVDGQPLDELIPDGGLDLVTAMSYACQIADGLNSAHQKYIIHRDIKPQNIMLSSEGTLKILDFGIAGLIKRQSPERTPEIAGEHQTKTMAVGTPSYMSPEQARGLNLDQRSDIFSFGILLYQMLSGQRPFQGKDMTAIQKAVCEGQYQPVKQLLPDLPDKVVTLLDKMLAPQKDERWQSSAELAEALHKIHSELTYKKNWWQKRHWLTKAAILIPFIVGLAWSVKDVLFPASTQQLIERQLAEATKVAILPFDNISGDPTLQLFGDGLAVNLSTDLTKVASEIGDAWIVPATEIGRMENVTPKAVADKYGVELILTGSMQHMGSTRLVVLNLLNAHSGQQLKTTELNVNADDLFEGHALIREQAMALLDWPISDALVSKFNAERPELDGAYRHYVEGRGYLYRYDQSNNLERAIKSFKDAIHLDPGYENSYIGISEVLLNQYRSSRNPERLEDMEYYVSKLESLNPQNNQLNFIKAELAANKGDYELAIQLYQASIKTNPNYVRSLTGIANAYKNKGNKVKAENYFKNALSVEPNNWRVVSDLGIFYYTNGQYEKAEKEFSNLIEMSPNNHYSYKLLAASYFARGNVVDAIKYTRIANEILPSDSGFSNLGTMLFSIKKYDQSVIAYEKAIEINDARYVVWGNLADSYKLTNNSLSNKAFLKAVKKAKEVLSINPNDSAVKADLSYYLANLDLKEEAYFYAEQINENNDGFENFIVALAYDHFNEVSKALSHLKIAKDKNYPANEIKNTPLLINVQKTDLFRKLFGVEE